MKLEACGWTNSSMGAPCSRTTQTMAASSLTWFHRETTLPLRVHVRRRSRSKPLQWSPRVAEVLTVCLTLVPALAALITACTWFLRT